MELPAQQRLSSWPARHVVRWVGVGVVVALIWLDYGQLSSWLHDGIAWLTAWPARLATPPDADENSNVLLLLLVGLGVLGFAIGRHPSPPG